MFDIGIPELLLIIVAVLFLFGAKKVPEVARALGQSVNAFKSGLKDLTGEAESVKPAVQKSVVDTKA